MVEWEHAQMRSFRARVGVHNQVVGMLAQLPLSLLHVNQPPHVVTLLLGPQSSAQLGKRGLAQTHPARNAGVRWGPVSTLHRAPGSVLRHKGLILQDPRDPQIPGHRKNGLSDPPQKNRGSHPTEQASVAMATRPPLPLLEDVYACARVLRARPPENSISTLPRMLHGVCVVTSRGTYLHVTHACCINRERWQDAAFFFFLLEAGEDLE